tara:strand:+ start:243 stop:785 length:543 start_codon:yes stop_codon:yes gene_type:complete
MKKLTILLIFSLIPAMSFSEGRIFQDEECRRDKPFIDLWDTICPEDWVPFPSNNETEGAYFAPRSRLQIPHDVTEPDQIQLSIWWIYEYNERGMFGEDRIKAWWMNYHAECNKNRFKIADFHTFYDTKAKNKRSREIATNEEYEWLPIIFEETPDKEMNPFVLAMCNLEEHYLSKRKWSE